MKKFTTRDLIQRQNQLLEQQNELLKRLADKNDSGGGIDNGLLLPGEKIFVEDLFRDEIRDGFLVTAKRKRLWNIQLNLVAEFARICKKYNLRWFAYAGTLLGAVRHKGFIPWDDDIDICLLRPDYEKFKAVVKSEVKEPYFVDAWYDYHLEEEEPDIWQDATVWQIVKREHRSIWTPFWPIIRIRDGRTAFIQHLDRPHIHQGIWIDIFPFDPVPPFATEQQTAAFEIQREMLFAIALPDFIRDALNKKSYPLLLPREELERFLKLSHREKAAALDEFSLKNFSQTEFVGDTRDFSILNIKRPYKLKNFERTVYLPFEKTELPAPIGYEDCLVSCFGDWREMIFQPPHANFYSADFSYREFFDKIRLREFKFGR